jgi:hypothetical protein
MQFRCVCPDEVMNKRRSNMDFVDKTLDHRLAVRKESLRERRVGPHTHFLVLHTHTHFLVLSNSSYR